MRFPVISATIVTAMSAGTAYADTAIYGSLNLNGVSTSDVGAVVYAPNGAIFGINNEASVSQPNPAPAGSDTIQGAWDIKPAFGVSGAVGVDFGMVRAEAEVAYSRSTVRTFNVTQITTGGGGTSTDLQVAAPEACFFLGVTNCPTAGNAISLEGSGTRVRQLSAMANVWVDIPVGEKIEPYVGGGVGIIGIESDGEGKTAFAWQVGAGVAYNVSEKFAITADFRHRESNRINLDAGGGFGANFGRVKSNTYGIGVRIKF
jgi:opacity protein-like surface antigen